MDVKMQPYLGLSAGRLKYVFKAVKIQEMWDFEPSRLDHDKNAYN